MFWNWWKGGEHKLDLLMLSAQVLMRAAQCSVLKCSCSHAGKGAEKSVHCLSCLEGGERLEAAEDSEVVTEIEATEASQVLGIPDKIQNKNNRQGEISDQRLNISHLVLF